MEKRKGNVICPDCNGEKYIVKIYDEFPHTKYKETCKYCLGEGKVDWIDVLTDNRFEMKNICFHYETIIKNISDQTLVVRMFGEVGIGKSVELLITNNSFEILLLDEYISELVNNNQIEIINEYTFIPLSIIGKNI